MPLVTVNETPTLLTPTNIAQSVMFQTPARVMVARGGTDAPADTADWWYYEAGQGDRGALNDIFPGGSGSRLWARTTRGVVVMQVAYA